MSDSNGIKRLRQLVARRATLDEEIDDATEQLLRDGEYMDDIADALGKSREAVRLFRNARGIPDARDIRRAKGLSATTRPG